MRTRLGVATATACSTVLVGTALTVAATAAPPSVPAPTTDSTYALLLAEGGQQVAKVKLENGRITDTRTVTRLVGDTKLVGIDARIQDSLIYGVGDAGGVYRVLDDGSTRKVRQLTTALDGTAFGVDFNPAANALRIVSNTGQNLRQTFADTTSPTTVDAPLNYTAGVTASGIVAAAYTNNDLSADSGTTLFDIDAALDQVVTQAPANNGSLQLTGKLGADVTAIGFDIFTTLTPGGRAAGNTGYAVVPGEGTTLHEVSLLTGQAPVLRTLPGRFVDLAIQPAPIPAA